MLRKKFLSRYYTVKADNVHISVVPENRVLGVTLTEDLKWSAHASRTQESVAIMLGVYTRPFWLDIEY